jgi:hypothetical protein
MARPFGLPMISSVRYCFEQHQMSLPKSGDIEHFTVEEVNSKRSLYTPAGKPIGILHF